MEMEHTARDRVRGGRHQQVGEESQAQGNQYESTNASENSKAV